MSAAAHSTIYGHTRVKVGSSTWRNCSQSEIFVATPWVVAGDAIGQALSRLGAGAGAALAAAVSVLTRDRVHRQNKTCVGSGHVLGRNCVTSAWASDTL